ncbi:MAG: DUF2520 domain-containing protein [Proteobacteria bacterium]|nr:DUF2520 domain-containing protein [Pseudomonadota bacterium]
MTRINIIGCGRAAGSLARLWGQAGSVHIGGVCNRSLHSSRKAVEALGAGTPLAALDQFEAADFWLIGTSDEQIAPTAVKICQARADLESSIVFHLCGRYGTDILAPLADRGCRVAAVHPVRSLTHERISLAQFEGTAIVAEGNEETLDALKALFVSIGGVWLPVKNIDRGLYHAALSIISNVTKGVTWKAQNWLENAGIPDQMATAVAQKLLAITVEDIARSGAKHSMTGPIVRGDTSTVEAHLKALADGHSTDLDIYRVLARTVLELAVDRGDLDETTLERFKFLLG